MRKTWWLLVGSVALAGCGADAPAGPPLDTTADVQQLMAGMIDPAADVLWDAVGTVIDADGETYWAPETDEDWIAVQAAAMTLRESANLLMLGDRPRDQDGWMRHAQELMDAGAVALAAAEARDPDRVFDIGETVYNSCNSCHNLYWIGDEERRPVRDNP